MGNTMDGKAVRVAARRSAVWKPTTVADWVPRTPISGPFRQHVGTFVQAHLGVTARHL